MRVLVTGAAGTLGRATMPRLRAAGFEVLAFDQHVGVDAGPWVIGDVRERSPVDAAMAGIDIVVHAAALHGIHLAEHPAHEFHAINLTGSFNVWQAAVQHGVRGVVFSSTMGVYGRTRTPLGDDEVAVLDEDRPLEPTDIYGWTKAAGEDLCRYHLRAHGIPSVALRFGMFVPEPFLRYGIRLLYGGVHEDDVAASVVAAVQALVLGSVEHEVFNVEAPLPFTADDAADLRRDPMVVLDRHYPGSTALLRSRGVRSLLPVTELFPVGRLAAGLGMRPRHDVGEWLSALEGRPDEHTDADPPWP